VRETKSKTLEELDQVFSVPLGVHAAYGLRQIPYGIKKFVLFQNPTPEELYLPESQAESEASSQVEKGQKGVAQNEVA